MVYRKRYGKRHGRRRTFKRRFTRRVRYNKRGTKIHQYKRFTGALGTLTASSINPVFYGFNFSLNDLPNYTEFTALYDMYKINAIKFVVLPSVTENISLTGVNNPIASARMFSVIDYNDGTAPTTIDQLREYQTCKMTPILKKHKRYIYKPKIFDTNSFSISPWLGTSSPSTNYYGLKLAIEPILSTGVTSMDFTIECVYYLSFKNVK